MHAPAAGDTLPVRGNVNYLLRCLVLLILEAFLITVRKPQTLPFLFLALTD